MAFAPPVILRANLLIVGCSRSFRCDSGATVCKPRTSQTEAQFSSVTQSCPTLCDPMDCSTPGFPVHHQFPEFTQTHVHQVSDAIQPSFVVPFSSHLQSFPASGSFQKSQLFTKYWSFSFSISLYNEYSGLISFRINWFDLLAVQGTLKNLLQHHSSIVWYSCTHFTC